MKGLESALVIGAGIAGIRASLDLVESGFKVYLCDRSPYIGGTLVQSDKWFPDNHCGMCQLLPVFSRDSSSQYCLRQGLLHPDIELLPLSEVVKVEGKAGDFRITLKSRPSGVNQDLCLGCGLCTQVCPVEVPNEFNQGLDKRKAIYTPHPWLSTYIIDWDSCTECGNCVETCPSKAISLIKQEDIKELRVGAIILSTGFEGFDPRSATQYGYKRYPNVITSIELERILSPNGPTNGKLLRPSDGKLPESIAFLQCVGSRDVERNYCSSACCMYAIKEASLIKEANSGAEIYIFFMDLRNFGKGFYRYYEQTKEKCGINFVRSRIPVVKEEPKSRNLILPFKAEDGSITQRQFELVVLSVGQTPSPRLKELSSILGVKLNKHGFCWTDKFSPVETSEEGIYVCGSASGPKDISDTLVEASAAARQISRWGGKSKAMEDKSPGTTPEEARIAIFLCNCGGEIASVIDLKEMAKFSQELPGVICVEEVSYLCQKEILTSMKKKIEECQANRAILATCIPFIRNRLPQQVAADTGLDPSLVQSLDIREGAAWIHKDSPKQATGKARSLLSMAVERLRCQVPLPLAATPINQKALIIGGGLAGLTSALSLAEQGIEVHLIEKSARLGGNLKDIYFTLEGNDPQRLLDELTKKVEANSLIHLYEESEVVEVKGYAGDFTATIKDKEGGPEVIGIGAIIIATGGQEWQPTEYLYGQDERIITQKELEKRLSSGELDPKGLNSIVMVQCVGSRENERPYCSRLCCSQALKNSLILKEQNPEMDIAILYRDIMSYGFNEEFYTQAREKGIKFIRYEPEEKPEVKLKEGKLEVKVDELVLGGKLMMEPDLVVLSPAIIPQDNRKLSQMLDVELSEEGFFQEAEAKFRPVEFSKDGIFLCGLAHSPRNIRETIIQAQAASQRAISMLASGQLQSGRTVSEVNERWCAGCEVCVQVCPYKARVMDVEKGVVVVRETLCRGCGACVAACPSGAARLRGFTGKQVLSMIDALA